LLLADGAAAGEDHLAMHRFTYEIPDASQTIAIVRTSRGAGVKCDLSITRYKGVWKINNKAVGTAAEASAVLAVVVRAMQAESL
jgi:hypothetical protein